MKKNQPIKAYKVTNENMQCLGFQYELNKKFTIDGNIEICQTGFHYCPIAADCFGYYTFTSSNRVFEILDHGTPIIKGDKNCTNKIEFVKELSWQEVLTIVNMGKDNTGLKNSGNSNSGNSNSGNWNSGNWNSGNSNSGNSNSGNSNSGNWNSGNRNSGDSNSGYRNSGAFCTDSNPRLILFDVQTDILIRDWENMDACKIMNNLDPNIWVYSSEMTLEEKAAHPSHETTGGYLKSIPYKEAWLNLWGNLSDSNKKVFTSLPHFDKDKFYNITGISV